MPTFKKVDKDLEKGVKELEGNIVRVGTKPWAYFYGKEATKNGESIKAMFKDKYGNNPSFSGKPWRNDQTFDYAIRLD